MSLNKVSFKVCCAQLNKVIKANSVSCRTLGSISLSMINVFLHVYAYVCMCECICVCTLCLQMMFVGSSSGKKKDFLVYDNISHLFDACPEIQVRPLFMI